MTISQGNNEDVEGLGYFQVNSRTNQRLTVFTLKKGYARTFVIFYEMTLIYFNLLSFQFLRSFECLYPFKCQASTGENRAGLLKSQLTLL